MSEQPAFDYSHREEDNVVVQDLTDWDGDTEGMKNVEAEWTEIASQDHITATAVKFNSDMHLGPETQEHLAREWNPNAQEAGIDRAAFVSDGLQGLAVSANLDIDLEVRSFSSFENAVEWAKD